METDNALHQEPLVPFSPSETVLSIPRWGVSLTHLGGWLALFAVLDKTVLPGTRFDKLGKFVCRRVTDLLGVEVVQHRLEKLDPQGSYIFCINHVSLLDLFVVFQSIPYFHRSFQDATHFAIPIYGGCIRIFGQLPVSRKDKALNKRSFAEAMEKLEAKESFVVFPEGHRTRDGRLGSFYPGAFRLALDSGTPVVPLALKGLRNICPAGDWRVRNGRVDVIFGDPISARGLTAEQLAKQARSALDALFTRSLTS